MQKRTILALAFLLLVGGGVVWKTTRPDPNLRPEKQPGTPTLKSAEIDELELAEPGKPKIHLKKEGADWRLVEPVADRADPKAVEAALQTLEKMRITDVVGETAATYEKLQVRDEDVLTVVAKRGGAPLATLLVGKTGRYLRLGGEPRVWQATDLARYSLAREPRMWRDREILKLDRDLLDRVELSLPGGARVALRNEAPRPEADEHHEPARPGEPAGPEPRHKARGDAWAIAEGAELVGGALDTTMATALVGTLTRLDAMDFADGVTAGAAGLDAPAAAVAAVLSDGTRRELLVGKEDGQDVYVKRADADRIWKVRRTTFENVLKPPAQWRDKTVAKVAAAEIGRIEIAQGAERVVLSRQADGGWKAEAPATLTALDPGKVQMLTSSFANLRATALDEGPLPAEVLGTVQVTKTDGSTFTITIGAKREAAYPITVTGRPEVLLLSESSVNRMLVTAEKLKQGPQAAGPGGPGAMGMPPGMPMPPRR